MIFQKADFMAENQQQSIAQMSRPEKTRGSRMWTSAFLASKVVVTKAPKRARDTRPVEPIAKALLMAAVVVAAVVVAAVVLPAEFRASA